MDADRLLAVARHARAAGVVRAVHGGFRAGKSTKVRRALELRNRQRNWRGVPDVILQSAQEAQIAHHNREIASMRDYAMQRPVLSRKPKIQKVGSGKWRQRTPEETLRIAYSKPSLTLRAIAATSRPRVNHSQVAELFFACASLHQTKQDAAITAKGQEAFEVFMFVFDETKFEMMQAVEGINQKTAVDVSILGLHGRLLRGDGEGQNNEDEVVLNPVAIETNSAAAMWSALRHVLPSRLWLLLRGVTSCRAAAILPAQDSHSANKMLLTHVENC